VRTILVPRRTRAGRLLRCCSLVALVVLVLLLTSGCLRYRADLRVDGDDTVSGQLVVAVKIDMPGTVDQTFDIPDPVRDRVTVSGYRADGYVGSVLTLDRLRLAEVSTLFDGMPRNGATVRLSMSRAGDRVVADGSVFFPDLSALGGSNDGFDVRFAITFAGDVLASNGQREGRTVSWRAQPGQQVSLHAEAYQPLAGGILGGAAGGGAGGGMFGGRARGLLPAGWLAMVAAAAAGALLTGLVALWWARRSRRQPAGYPPQVGAGRYPGAPARAAVPPGPVPPGPAQPRPPAPVPPGPGLSPEATQRLPTLPLPPAPAGDHERG
jgi:hypothetical protein